MFLFVSNKDWHEQKILTIMFYDMTNKDYTGVNYIKVKGIVQYNTEKELLSALKDILYKYFLDERLDDIVKLIKTENIRLMNRGTYDDDIEDFALYITFNQGLLRDEYKTLYRINKESVYNYLRHFL